MWQIRHQGNLRYVDSSTGGSAYRYNAVRSWIQHPIAALSSILMLGDSYTDSSLFGSLSFIGIKLATDERMWPQGKRGYAPEVRGTAGSSSKRRYTENTLSLSISMPLNWAESRSSVAFNYNQSHNSRSGTTSLTGSAGENSDLSWSGYGGYERYRDGSGQATTWYISFTAQPRGQPAIGNLLVAPEESLTVPLSQVISAGEEMTYEVINDTGNRWVYQTRTH